MHWEPKLGTGWLDKLDAEGRTHWGLMLDGTERGPLLFVTVLDDDVFEIGYSPRSFEYELPSGHHIQRIGRDFSVAAWSVRGFARDGNGVLRLRLQARAMGPVQKF